MDRMILNDVFGFAAGIVSIACFTAIVLTWLKLRSRKLGAGPELNSRLAEISERLGHLDTAVDAMAIEVERISEAQRFTTRLLADRPAAGALTDLPRATASTTPH